MICNAAYLTTSGHAYPLSEAPKAIRYLEQGRARGQIVITI